MTLRSRAASALLALAPLALLSCSETPMESPANQLPTARFTAGCAELTCTFDASASSDSDGSISSYSWDFGDGASGSGATPAHVYTDGGTYMVSLTVTDDDGGTGVDTEQVMPTDPPLRLAQLGADILGAAVDDGFGWEVEMSDDGTRIAVGAPNNDAAANQAGHVRVFEWEGATWVQLGQDIEGSSMLTTPSIGDARMIDLSGDGARLAVGTWRYDANRGRVDVYEYDGATWSAVGGIIEGAPGQDHWGESVALSTDGSRVAVGAPNTNTGAGPNAGAALVFELVGGVWAAMGAPLEGDDSNDRVGHSVALSGDGTRLVVGADGHAGSGDDAGIVRVFDWDGAAWIQTGADISGDDTQPGAHFGTSVAISRDGSRIAGAAGQQSGIGEYVEVYELNGNAWGLVGDRFPTPYNSGGKHLALSADGERLALGQPLSGSPSGLGAIQVFAWTTAWTQVGIDVFGDQALDHMGHAVSISADGTRVVAGIPNHDAGGADSGTVRVYSVPAEDPQLIAGGHDGS